MDLPAIEKQERFYTCTGSQGDMNEGIRWGEGENSGRDIQNGGAFEKQYKNHMKVILMKSANSREYRVPTAQLLSPNKASSTKTELQALELLAKEVP